MPKIESNDARATSPFESHRHIHFEHILLDCDPFVLPREQTKHSTSFDRSHSYAFIEFRSSRDAATAYDDMYVWLFVLPAHS